MIVDCTKNPATYRSVVWDGTNVVEVVDLMEASSPGTTWAATVWDEETPNIQPSEIGTLELQPNPYTGVFYVTLGLVIVVGPFYGASVLERGQWAMSTADYAEMFTATPV